MIDTTILGGYVVTLDEKRILIPDGGIAIDGDRIVGVGTRSEIESEFNSSQVVEANNQIVMPGLIDGHAHAGHGLVKGLGLHHNRWFQVCEKIYSEASSEDFWHAEALLTSLERLRFGTTTTVMFFGGGNSVMRLDDPVYADRHCEAVKSVGLKEFITIGPRRPPYPRRYLKWVGDEFSEVNVSFENILDNCKHVISKWNGADEGRIKVAIMFPTPHPEVQPILGDQLRDLKYQSSELRELSKKNHLLFTQDGHNRGTIKYIHEELDLLGPDALLNHSLDISAEEIELCKKTGTKIVHSIGSRAACRGRCPVPELIDTGVVVMLASDADGPDTTYDMFRHMYHCQKYHQFYYKNTSWMPPGKVLEMATIDAAKALGMEREIGSIEKGKKADIVIIDGNKPHLRPLHTIIDKIVSYANGGDVDTVFIDGKILLKNKEVLPVNEKEILEYVEREYSAMLNRSGYKELEEYPDRFWGSSKLNY